MDTYNINKPQKSSFWIWTTLWLTSFIDSALIATVIFFILAFLTSSSPTLINLSSILAYILGLWLGSWMAVNYVLKRSIVAKTSATKFGILSIVIPFVFWALTLSKYTDISHAVGALITLALVFYFVRRLIMVKGD